MKRSQLPGLPWIELSAARSRCCTETGARILFGEFQSRNMRFNYGT